MIALWEDNSPFWSTSMSICERSYESSAGSVDMNWDILSYFGVSIPFLGMVLESQDMSQEAEKVFGSLDMTKRGMMDRKR